MKTTAVPSDRNTHAGVGYSGGHGAECRGTDEHRERNGLRTSGDKGV